MGGIAYRQNPQILTHPARGVQVDVEKCLSELDLISKTAAKSYLEFAVFTKKDIVWDSPDFTLNFF